MRYRWFKGRAPINNGKEISGEGTRSQESRWGRGQVTGTRAQGFTDAEPHSWPTHLHHGPFSEM